MEIELLGCGYTFLKRPFSISYTEQLPHFLFRLQAEGSSHALVNGRIRKINTGDLLLYRSGDPYELRVDYNEDGEISSGDYYLFCKGDWIEQWWNRSFKSTCTHIDLDERILSLWRHLHIEKHKVGETNVELIGFLLAALCVSLERAVSGASLQQGNSPKNVKFISNRMKRYIEDHATKTFKIEDVAQHVGLSVSRAVTLFKASFHLTMIQYAIEIKLSTAIELMNYSTFNLEQIAFSSGFGNYAYFHKVFRKKFGVSPTEYRLNGVQHSQHFKEGAYPSYQEDITHT
jgi:AraC family transcriptional regulator of arabinose operon